MKIEIEMRDEKEMEIWEREKRKKERKKYGNFVFLKLIYIIS